MESTEKRWNAKEIEAWKAQQTGDESQVRLTPVLLRVLGEGIRSLDRGDAQDIAAADILREELDAMGFAVWNGSVYPKSLDQESA